jgi:hypothetical protein
MNSALYNDDDDDLYNGVNRRARQRLRQRINEANRPTPKQKPSVSATVLPFPIKRQRRVILNRLQSVSDAPSIEAAMSWLDHDVADYFDRLKGMGVDDETARSEARNMLDAFGTLLPNDYLLRKEKV